MCLIWRLILFQNIVTQLAGKNKYSNRLTPVWRQAHCCLHGFKLINVQKCGCVNWHQNKGSPGLALRAASTACWTSYNLLPAKAMTSAVPSLGEQQNKHGPSPDLTALEQDELEGVLNSLRPAVYFRSH